MFSSLSSSSDGSGSSDGSLPTFSFDSVWSLNSTDLSSGSHACVSTSSLIDLTPPKKTSPQLQQLPKFAPMMASSPVADLIFPTQPAKKATPAAPQAKGPGDSAQLHFTEVNKMSLFSLEKRIDYHLSRIMKGHRLINFKNSIERLSTEKRICECILEVLMSSMNLITRKAKTIVEAKAMAEYMSSMADQVSAARQQVGQHVQLLDSADYSASYLAKLAEVKTLAVGLEQIIWALNSNKEHIKYIVKVFTVPEQYQRSEFSTDLSSIVPMRAVISQTIGQCEEVIVICRLLRTLISESLTKCFLNHFN